MKDGERKKGGQKARWEERLETEKMAVRRRGNKKKREKGYEEYR